MRVIATVLAALAALSVASATPASGCTSTYKVKSGNNCGGIANAFKMTTAGFKACNPGLSCSHLKAGTTVCTACPAAQPVCNKVYRVGSSETCGSLTTAKKISLTTFQMCNPGVSCVGSLPAGEHVCLSCNAAPLAITSVAPTPMPKTTSTSVRKTDTSTSVAKPKATLPVTCTSIYKSSNPSCTTIRRLYGSDYRNLIRWNPTMYSCAYLPTYFKNQDICVSPPMNPPLYQPPQFRAYKNTPIPGKIIELKSASTFCGFLPPDPRGAVAPQEGVAKAFCTNQQALKDTQGLTGNIYPTGWIRSAKYVANATAGWVQVTGQINRDAYKNAKGQHLSPTDGGGQYDPTSTKGAVCLGYNTFLHLLEPDSGVYCIRCCQSDIDCWTGTSTQGCRHLIPADNYDILPLSST
ncbi:hypothetical protein BZG36_03449 [Bifiguratus adelaidae]|uniref:LysM domain-containing protein n=1 Tax=Bifiguratus adelaidae TaxID=1938954 RepID=A0A261XY26_9FUNG|nr:hypothetical protein BZG36_03449 [Bifiguratus adelaidae]